MQYRCVWPPFKLRLMIIPPYSEARVPLERPFDEKSRESGIERDKGMRELDSELCTSGRISNLRVE